MYIYNLELLHWKLLYSCELTLNWKSNFQQYSTHEIPQGCTFDPVLIVSDIAVYTYEIRNSATCGACSFILIIYIKMKKYSVSKHLNSDWIDTIRLFDTYIYEWFEMSAQVNSYYNAYSSKLVWIARPYMYFDVGIKERFSIYGLGAEGFYGRA